MTSAPACVAALLVALAVAAVVPAPPAERLRRLQTPVASTRSTPTRAGRLLRRILARRRRTPEGLDAVVVLVDRLAALTRAGLAAPAVWEHLAAVPGPMRPLCAFVAESIASGGSTAGALRDAAPLAAGPGRGPGAEALDPAQVLRWVALALSVSERTGAPLAGCLDRLVSAVRAEIAAADERTTAVAGPRATAQVLGWLPVAGVGLGALLGADPLRALLWTSPGRLCLFAGTALWAAGRLWSRTLVRGAARAGE